MIRNRSLATLAILVLVAVWALPGCKSPVDNSATNEMLTREQTVNLDDPYGGYNLGDESPAFGDAMLAADYGPESIVEYSDPMETDPRVVDIRKRPHRQRYLMITWGNLRADTTIDYVTDWSGGLCVENGVVLLKRTIRFDAHDRILPRTSRDTIEWESRTRPHYDGVLVALHKIVRCDSLPDDSLRTARDTTRCDALPMTVTFKTGPLEVTFTEDELKDLHKVFKVDDAGNAVAFNTIVVEPQPCAGGFVAGQWKDVDGRPGGIFRGKWISHNGLHMGYLRGVYGQNKRNENVFFGKWVARNGRFEGLLRGHYGRSDDGEGWFEGVWLNRRLDIAGGLKGKWVKSDRKDEGGYFRGEWSRRCANTDAR